MELGRRFYGTAAQELTHVDAHGKASMVNVGDKQASLRKATATGRIYVGKDILAMIKGNGLKKGDVLSVARISGIMGAKRTADLIPLCHNIFLDSIKVELILHDDQAEVEVIATVQCGGKTGVEMEALVAVSTSLLTIYDMCKAVSHNMVIKDVQLLMKTGGKKDYYSGEYKAPE